MKYRKVELLDIGEDLLNYCMEIKEEGFEVNQYPLPIKIAFPLPVKPIKKDSHKFALKTYAKNRTGETIFITADGKTYMAKGEWIIPYLKEVDYTEGSYGTTILDEKNQYIDPEVDEEIHKLIDHDPYGEEERNKVFRVHFLRRK